MNFLYIPIFCVFFLPTRGYITFAVMRPPGSTSDNLDLKIDGSIDLGSNWQNSDVRDVLSKLGQSLRLDDQALTATNREVQRINRDWFDTHPRNKFGGYYESRGLHQQHKGGKSNNGDYLKGRFIIGNGISKAGQHSKLDVRAVAGNNREVQRISEWLVTHPRNKGGYYESSGLHQQHKGSKLDNRDDLRERITIGNGISKTGQNLKQDDRGLTGNNREVQRINEDWFVTPSRNKFVGYKSGGWLQQHEPGKSDKQDDLRERIVFGKGISKTGQSLGLQNRVVIQNNRGVQHNNENRFHTPPTNKFVGYKSGGWLQQHKGRKSENKSDKKDVEWNWDDIIKRQGEKLSETRSYRAASRRKRLKDGIVGVTQLERMETTDHKVKDDERTNEFSVHMFKQTMQIFESIKRKMGTDELKAKVDEMARSYKDQFGDFVRQQRDTAVRTKTGDERAVLHTMDTSNLILQRLVNFLKADMEKVNSGPHSGTLQREVDAARDLEYKHVCSKYGYCRSDKGFTTMLQNCIKILINVDNEKMYRARDAITEVLKTGDYSNLIDSKTDISFKQKISRLERKEPEDLRVALRVLLGILGNLETPLEVEGGNSEVVKKTAAFYTLLAMWEDAMPADESNKLEWADIERSLGDWSGGKRSDIQEIIKALERNMKRGLQKMDPDTAVKMKEQIKIIRG